MDHTSTKIQNGMRDGMRIKSFDILALKIIYGPFLQVMREILLEIPAKSE